MPAAKAPERRVDPFALTPDAGVYVPRAATEAALARLTEGLDAPGAVLRFVAPEGAGKTLLLRVLAGRLGERDRVLPLLDPRLSGEELCAWALGELGVAATPDPARALRAEAERLEGDGTRLALFIDDGSRMPRGTVAALAALLEDCPALRVVVATTLAGEDEEDALEPLWRAVGDRAAMVFLDGALTLEETRAYVTARLDHDAVDDRTRARFDADTIASIYRSSEGIPARIHAAADALNRGIAPEAKQPLSQNGNVAETPGVAQTRATNEDSEGSAEPAAPASPAERERPRTERATPDLPGTTAGDRAAIEAIAAQLAAGQKPLQKDQPAEPAPASLGRGLRTTREHRPAPPLEASAPTTAEPAATAAAPQPDLPAAAAVPTPLPVPFAGTARRARQMQAWTLRMLWGGGGFAAGLLIGVGALFFVLRGPAPADPDTAATAVTPVAPAPSVAPEPAGEVLAGTPPAEIATAADSTEREVAGTATNPEELRAEELGPEELGAEAPGEAIDAESEASAAAVETVPVEVISVSESVAPSRTPDPTEAVAEPTPEPAVQPALQPAAPQVARIEPAPAAPVAPEAAPAPAVSTARIAVSVNARPWASIEVDGRPVGETPLGNLLLSKGPHRFVARFPDGTVAMRNVVIDEDTRHVAFR